MANRVMNFFSGTGFRGARFHIPIDSEQRAIFCEGHDRATALSEALGIHCNIKTSMGEEQEITGRQDKRQIMAFPVHVSGVDHSNLLVLSVTDPIIAAGLEALLRHRRVHSTIELFAIDDSRRSTGGNRHNGNGR